MLSTAQFSLNHPTFVRKNFKLFHYLVDGGEIEYLAEFKV